MTESDFLITEPKVAEYTLLFAHGAGAPMDSGFMNTVAEGLSVKGCQVVRFEFPYMRERRESGKKAPPNRAPILIETWNQVIGFWKRKSNLPLFIGGKSMGGRLAAMVADSHPIQGLVCLGFPFHPPGRKDKSRVDTLREIKTPTLVLQGERDNFGTKDEVELYSLSEQVEVQYLVDGDHSFKPRKSAPVSEADNLAAAVETMNQFFRKISS